MEIQTFFLASKITPKQPMRYEVHDAALAALFYSPESQFPVRIGFPFLMQLAFRSTFPTGLKYLYFSSKIDFEFPHPEEYRLDITMDEALTGNAFQYGFDVAPRKACRLYLVVRKPSMDGTMTIVKTPVRRPREE